MKHYAGFMVNLINANAQLGSFGPIMLSNKAIGDKHFLLFIFYVLFKKNPFCKKLSKVWPKGHHSVLSCVQL